MNNYYQILGVNKNATNQEIEYQYTILKTSNHLDGKKLEAYAILSDYQKRRKYDELPEKKSKFSLFKIPFFGYDFDEIYNSNINYNETYTSKYSFFNGVQNLNSEENKKYKIDNNKYLIFEKKNVNGVITKNYYIEIDGKREQLSEDIINKIKNKHYEKKSFSLLKDKQLN
jgi:DnaJ-class molecular chaperone